MISEEEFREYQSRQRERDATLERRYEEMRAAYERIPDKLAASLKSIEDTQIRIHGAEVERIAAQHAAEISRMRAERAENMRDSFAARAMEAMIVGGTASASVDRVFVARAAYALADEMIRERRVPPEDVEARERAAMGMR